MFEDNSDFGKLSMGERMRKFRAEGELSVAEVAAYLGKKEKVVLDYENDVKRPPLEDLWLLCLLYYCSLDCFCEPLCEEIAKRNENAARLIKYMRYMDKFYFSNRYFPQKEEYKALWAIADYEIFPRRKYCE